MKIIVVQFTALTGDEKERISATTEAQALGPTL